MPIDDANVRHIQETNIRIVIEHKIIKIKLRNRPIKIKTPLTSNILDKTINTTKFININSNIITKIDRFMPEMQIISKNISQIEPEIIW